MKRVSNKPKISLQEAEAHYQSSKKNTRLKVQKAIWPITETRTRSIIKCY